MYQRLLTLSSLTFLFAAGMFGQGLNTQASKDDWEEINFEFNSSVLTDGYPSLLRIAELLNKNPGYQVKVEGNTDNIGNKKYNEKLGQQRADTVRDFLIKYGAQAGQITATTRGFGSPKVQGYKKGYSKTDEARWMNRRVVLTVSDTGGKVICDGCGMADVLKKPEVTSPNATCCEDILKRLDKLDDIARMLKELMEQNAGLRQEIAGLKEKQAEIEHKVAEAPSASAQAAATTATAEKRIEKEIAKDKESRFALLGANLGVDGNHDVTFTGAARYFAPFHDNFALQANGEYLYFHDQREGQFDIGLVDRIGNFQAGLFSSFKHVDSRNFNSGRMSGGTLGEAAFTADYLFNRGKVGLFGTAPFLNDAVLDRSRLPITVANGDGTFSDGFATDLFLQRYLHIVNQYGASATIGLAGDVYAEGNLGYLRASSGGKAGGTLRFIFPIKNHFAFTLEGGVNETMVGPGTNGRVVFGVRLGNFLRPKDYLTVTHPVPVDVPRVRYEVLTRVVQVGSTPPVADAGPDQIGIPAATVTLNGTGSYDPNGRALTYSWLQEAGPAVALSGANMATATFTATSGQSYSFKLTVRNAPGLQASARTRVTTTTPVPTLKAQLLTCSASPLNIMAGESSTISYQTTNADTVTIDNGIGSVPKNGSRVVSPTVSTTYVVTATNAAGSDTCSVAVQVTAGAVPRILSYTATLLTINSNALAMSDPSWYPPNTTSSTLSWSVENATSVTITPGVGSVALTGAVSVAPPQTTTYLITATNKFGSVTGSLTINVNNVLPPPQITSFTANPPVSPSPGSPVVLNCQATNTTKVYISGVGPVDANGNLTVSPMATRSYLCTASGTSTVVSQALAVTVTP